MHPTQAPRTPAATTAITALATITASGVSIDELFDDILNGRKRFTSETIPLVANALPTRSTAEEHDEAREIHAAHVRVPLPLADVVGARVDRTLTRDSRLLIHAASTAWPDRSDHLPDRTGVVLGTLRAGRNEYLAIHNAAGGRGKSVNPVWGPQAGYNAAAAQLSIVLPAQGPNITLTSGATAGLDAVVMGARYIRDAVCDTVLAAGLDTLSVAAAEPPAGADRVPQGEAAAVLVLEDGDAEEARVLARVLGTGQDVAAVAGGESGTSLTDELSQAARKAVRDALHQAGRRPAEVGLAVVHSTGDSLSEAAVHATLDAVFDADLRVCDVTRTTGRAGGADGALAVAVAVEALRRGVLPPAEEDILPSAGESSAGSFDWAPSAGRLALCLGVDRSGSTTAVLLGRPERAETA